MKVYQLLGDIKLEFDDSHLKYAEETYHRELDLDTATVRVKYSVAGVEFLREHFVSKPDQVIVAKISTSKSGSLSFTESLNKLESIKNLSYSQLYAHHLDDYQNLFHRVSLQLSKSSKSILGKTYFELTKKI